MALAAIGGKDDGKRLCMDCDPGCPVCHGRCTAQATEVAYRIDMIDETGTPVCDDCAGDMSAVSLHRFVSLS